MEHRIAFTPSQAAAATGVPVDQIVAAAMSGTLRSHVASGNVVILRADLENFISRLPSLPAATAEVREADARKAGEVARARGKAIAAKTLAPAPVEPGRARGRALANRILNKGGNQ